MTEPGRCPGHSGLPRIHEEEQRQDKSVLRRHDMAAAVFQTVKTDHNHASGSLYVRPPSPTMPPSPPWKEQLAASTSPNKVDKVPSPTSDNEVGVGDKKPKRRRSSFLSSSSELSPTSKSTAAVSGAPRLTERQQLALLLQMTAEKRDDRDCGGGYEAPRSAGSRSSRRTSTGRNERGELPLHRAARRGDVRQTKKLLKDGADVNCRDYAGWTPLHEASNHGRLSVARELLRAGADSNAQGLDNNSPLHDAAVNGHAELVQLLLRHGANPLAKNSDGESPLDVSSAAEVTRLLRSEIITSSSSDDDYDVRSPTSPESDVDDLAMRSPADTEPADMTTGHTQFDDDKHSSGVFSLTPPPEIHHVDVKPVVLGERDDKTAPRSPSFADESLASTAASLPLAARSGRASPSPSPVKRKFTVSRQMARSSSSSSSPRLTLKFQQVKRHAAPQLNNGRWRSTSGSDVINNRCADARSSVEESCDAVPRDTVSCDPVPHEQVDQQDVDDVKASSPVVSIESSIAEDEAATEPGRLFENISDVEDELETSLPLPVDSSQDVSPVSMFRSPAGLASTFDKVQTWSCSVPDDCSSLLPAASAACQFIPADSASTPGPDVPDVPFHPTLTSPPPPPLEEMMTAGVILPRAMTPLTIDTSFETAQCQEVADVGHASTSGAEVMDTAQQQGDDVTDTSDLTSCLTSYINRSAETMSVVMDQPAPTTSVSFFDETSSAHVSPSPPKIPRLRIVMGASDTSQSTTSPGSSTASLPYVVTLDDVPTDVAEQSDFATSPQRDVMGDVTEASSLVESGSSQQRKVKHGASTKEKECDEAKDAEANDDSRLVADDEAQIQTLAERRVTRSTVRQQLNKCKQKAELSAGSAHDSTQSESNSGIAVELTVDGGSTTQMTDATDEENLWSRRQKHCKQRVDLPSSTLPLSTSIPPSPRKPTNPYSLYSMLRKKVAERQAQLLGRRCDVRLPARYRDYLIVKRNYRLHGTENVVSALQVKPPKGLTGKMRELFCEQERQRQELMLQHSKERVRLTVQAEQETLRVYERMSRVGSVLSVCSVLDSVTAHHWLPGSDVEQCTRDSSRNCDEMMRDIQEKFIRLRDDLLVRHHHEADILCATQRLQWGWASRRCSDQQTWTAPTYSEYVPLVDVNDRLELLLI